MWRRSGKKMTSLHATFNYLFVSTVSVQQQQVQLCHVCEPEILQDTFDDVGDYSKCDSDIYFDC